MVSDYIETLERLDKPLTEFEDITFCEMVDEVSVQTDRSLWFKMNDGMTLIYEFKKN